MMQPSLAFTSSLCLLLAVGVLTACSEPPPPAPVVEVMVDRARQFPYTPNTEFVGRLEAEDDVKIQAKVSGYLKARVFHEGDLVKAGDLLYQIDPAQFQAELAKAKAALAKAKASVNVAQRNFKRGEELRPKGFISESEFDQLTARKLEADAELASAEAQVQGAELNLGYTTIRAPIGGRIDRSGFSVGDLIGPDSGTLTTLVSIDPIKASFQVSERAFLAADQRRRDMEKRGVAVEELSVTVELTDHQRYPHGGHIEYIANRVDNQTGTIEARASIANPDGELRPGQYVKVIVGLPFAIDTLMVPQAAVQADQQGSFVLAVGPDNKVVRRTVTLEDRVGEWVVVRTGVEVGERVIVRGLQRVQAGQVVKVQEMPPTAEPPLPAAESVAPDQPAPAIEESKPTAAGG